jgi:RNA polymerase sigma-70 factor (ECF subfamily)
MIAQSALRPARKTSPTVGGVAAFVKSVMTAPDLDAQACVARIVAIRDREAFKILFLAFAPKVKTYLIRHGASVAQAEELAQEALLTVWRKAEYYDPARASVAAWLFTIARNLRIDAIRKEQSAMAYALASPPAEASEQSPEDDRETAEREARLREAVSVLPAEQMEVVRLSFFHDKPHAEIARDLCLPLGTVKSRLRLAVVKLRSVLGDLA